MAAQVPTRRRSTPPGSGSPPTTQDIPDKLYFRIGEVARLCGIPTYVLRFWESEFIQLKPNKGGTGQRLYRRRDVEIVIRIKRLLYEEGYTIPGARQVIRAELRAGREAQLGLEGVSETIDSSHFAALYKELRELHSLLSRPAAQRQSLHPIRAPRSTAVKASAPSSVHAFPRRPSAQNSTPLFAEDGQTAE